MDNYISRQQTIDALNDLITGVTESCFEWIYKDDALEAVKQLPSAEPKIVRCRDCKYAELTFGGEVKYCDFWQTEDPIYMSADNFCSNAEKRVVTE